MKTYTTKLNTEELDTLLFALGELEHTPHILSWSDENWEKALILYKKLDNLNKEQERV